MEIEQFRKTFLNRLHIELQILFEELKEYVDDKLGDLVKEEAQ